MPRAASESDRLHFTEIIENEASVSLRDPLSVYCDGLITHPEESYRVSVCVP
jgi:hypothetical protein